MQLLRHPSPSIVHRSVPPRPQTIYATKPRLDAIRELGIVRVGYVPDDLPFSYFNSRGELVGFDVDMAHLLADELNCTVEFIPFDKTHLVDHLENRDFDVAMSGVPITTANLSRVRFSTAYLRVSLAFVVRDHRRRDFSTTANIHRLESLKLAMPKNTYYQQNIGRAVSDATVIEIDSPRDFFDAPVGQFDAMILDAESGSAWTFIYPGYRVVVPEDLRVKQPLAYAVSRQEQQWEDFLSQWIALKKDTGEFDQFYNHWILGDNVVEKPPRWSIIRDVLGWAN